MNSHTRPSTMETHTSSHTSVLSDPKLLGDKNLTLDLVCSQI